MENFAGKTYLTPELSVLTLEHDVIMVSGESVEFNNGDLIIGDIRW